MIDVQHQAPASTLEAYRAFLEAKAELSQEQGFPCEPEEVNPLLKPFQRQAVAWAVRGGRRALFESFGLGKTMQQLEIVRLILAKAGSGRGLIVLPLGVRQEFVRDAGLLGLTVTFIRTNAEVTADGIYLTNYESVREGKLDPSGFAAVSLDEAAILRGLGGTKTFRELMKHFEGTSTYRFVATAVPSPNEYIELLAYSAFLGIMEVSEAKTRWFKRDSTKADQLTLHAHKSSEFWLWVSSWALFVEQPSDLCRCSCKGKNSQDNGSVDSSLSHGSLGPDLGAGGPGTVAATAGTTTAQVQTTSLLDGSSVADACVLSTEARERRHTALGSPCSIDASTRTTRTGVTTVGGESPFASDGDSSPTSSPTWGNLQTEQPSIELTTTGTTNLATAGGQTERSKPATDESARHTQTDAVTSTGVSPSKGTCCQKCNCDEGYVLPPLTVEWHQVPSDHSKAGTGRDGQGRLFADTSLGVTDASREKRASLDTRIERLRQIVAERDQDDQVVIWCDLNDEQRAIEQALTTVGISYSSLYGSQGVDERETLLAAWRAKATTAFVSKPVMYGSGVNLQQCHTMIFAGIGFKFSEFIQSIHRIHRFLQERPCTVHLIYTEAEAEVRAQLERKWEQHRTVVANMTAIIRQYGLASAAIDHALVRSIGVAREEVSGDGWTLVNNDCVDETYRMDVDSVDLILTSIPFSTMYEYSPSYNDFGHTDDERHFWQQMAFLSPQLLRVLRPGRNLVVHVKDRIVPGGLTKLGFQTVQPFHADAIYHYQRHGFAYLGMRTIVTDVVRENNQTYRLGWTEQCKDGSRMGVGMPEYLLLFRKPPTDRSNGYADVPVQKAKPLCDDHGTPAPFDSRTNWKKPVPGTGYSRARWQMDAHGFWRSSGDRLLSHDELVSLPHRDLYRRWRERSRDAIYDVEQHVQAAEELDHLQRLPASFMLLPPHSWHPDVWTDVTRMRTLNGAQWSKGKEMHLCPLQFDIVDRVIAQMSMPGELVMDPFSGLGTVALEAIKLGRRGLGVELSPRYHADAVSHLREGERKAQMPTLFDLLDAEAAVTEDLDADVPVEAVA